MLFRGAWAIEKGGSPCSFGRYGAQRHHFEAAHSIRLAPTDFRIQSALSRLMRSVHPRDPRPGVAINGQHGALTQVVTAVLVHKAADKVRFIFAEICHGLFRTDPYEL